MLDSLLRNALEGLTVIEDETGALGRILTRQLASYARAAGKKVSFASMEADDRGTGGDGGRELSPLRQSPTMREISGGGIPVTGAGSHVMGKAQKYVFLEAQKTDLVVLDGFSTFVFERSERELVELIRQILRQVKLKRSFILTYDKGLLSEKFGAYLRAVADSVIIVKTELTSDRVTRMLYVLKMRDSKPIDRLIKVTIDEAGVQVDTREFVG